MANINPNRSHVPYKHTKCGEEIYMHAPLLVRQILKSQPIPYETDVFALKDILKINFRSCLLHGFVVGSGVHNRSYYNYFVDDGTGQIQFSVSATPKESAIVKQLLNEVEALAVDPRKECKRMAQLLKKSLEFMDGSLITPGCNVLLHARPKKFGERIVLEVISFLIENERSNDLECAFTEFMLDALRS